MNTKSFIAFACCLKYYEKSTDPRKKIQRVPICIRHLIFEFVFRVATSAEYVDKFDIHLLAKYKNPLFWQIYTEKNKGYYLGLCGDLSSIPCSLDQVNKRVLNAILEGACLGGHLNVVKLIIENGATRIDIGMYNACITNRTPVTDYLISKFAKSINEGMIGACFTQNSVLID